MIESKLVSQVQRVAMQAQRLRFHRALASGLIVVIAIGLALLVIAQDRRELFALAVPMLCLGAAVVWLIARMSAPRSNDLLLTAREIEARFPTLGAKLLTALQQIEQAPAAGLGYLQQTVVRQAVEHSEQHDWMTAVNPLALRQWRVVSGTASAAVLLLLTTFIIAAQPFTVTPQNNVQLAKQAETSAPNAMMVEPGDVSIERGSSLIITARFAQSIPASTSLIIESTSASLGGAVTTRSLPMNASLDDPLAGVRVPAVASDFTYRISAQGVESPVYRVTVFDYPQLVQADASLEYPNCTALPVKNIEDTRQVTAVEGTKIKWSLRLNKAVASAKLIAESGDEIALTPMADNEATVQGEITLTTTRRYKLELIDREGRRNKHEVEFAMSALRNRVPDLKLVFPRRDLRVSPIEEALVVAQAWDDFGIKQFGITFSLAGSDMNEVTLARDLPAKTNHEASHLLSFEAMNAVPDQLLSYHFWADDVGPDGQTRRTFSDMFFAEVRPFEEIFREGQAPPQSEQQQQQQQQGQQQQIAEGIKEQREIINATWNLIRREISAQPTSAFKADAQAVREAQEAALQRMTQVKEALTDPQSLEHVEAVEKHMAQAASHLAQAADANDPSALKLALPAEQQAYQALLKLQAREHEVVRSQQQQRGQQSGQQQAGPSQQQLNELELKNQENRYETQRTAQEPQEDPQQRETRQALNRLRDLARRQQDLNEKLKELDLAIKEAATAQEKEELARELKRLREQQEEMLRDVDELRNRMEQANQQASQQQQQQQQQQQAQGQQSQQQQAQRQQSDQGKQSEQKGGEQKQSPQSLRERAEQAQADDARQQVDEVRQNIREATEALEKGMTSKALTEGTRAERKLEELREEFRKRASGQFADDVKEMRDSARELAQNQEALGEKMKQLDKQGPRSLRDTGQRKQVVDALGDQKEKLENLTDRMRQVTEEAETSQPLLSKQLYDTLRDADQSKVDEALDVTRQLFDKGFDEEAATVEPQARKGLNDLKRGVEKAADSVLGDEAEALRRARKTLDDLTREVEREAPEDQRQARAQSSKGNETRAITGDKQGDGAERQPAQKQAGKQDGEQSGDQPQDQKSAASAQGKQPGGAEKGGEVSGESRAQAPPSSKQGDAKGDRQAKGDGQQTGEQPGQQPGKSGDSTGKQASQGQPQSPGKQGQSKGDSPRPSLLDQLQSGTAGGGGSGPHGPITGENFREWSDRMRDVEEMIDDPKLREEVARVRDRAQAMRIEFKRHGKEPQWDDVKKLVADPLATLRDRLDDELARRDQKKDLVPIDRDPVPGQFTDLVKQYYERLGAGQPNE